MHGIHVPRYGVVRTVKRLLLGFHELKFGYGTYYLVGEGSIQRCGRKGERWRPQGRQWCSVAQSPRRNPIYHSDGTASNLFA